MYGPEKSIADAFHFEEYVGRDIALEAFKTYKDVLLGQIPYPCPTM
jgi:hypothetical protein